MGEHIRKKKLLLTGVSGFLGWNICCQVPKEWTIYGVYFSHPLNLPGISTQRADLRNFKEQKKIFETIRPEAVVHTAAIADPNFCQLNQEVSRDVNLEASLNLAGLCADYTIPLVFDGLHPPYAEDAPLSPVNVYGEQKALAEAGMRKRYPETLICRLPLMFGNPGPTAQSFIQPMFRAMKEGRELTLFVDEFRTPISGTTAAQGLFLALDKARGIIHLGGRERISRYDFGLRLKQLLGTHEAKLIPCGQKDISLAAPRSVDVSLNSRKAFLLGFNPPALTEDLKECIGKHTDSEKR